MFLYMFMALAPICVYEQEPKPDMEAWWKVFDQISFPITDIEFQFTLDFYYHRTGTSKKATERFVYHVDHVARLERFGKGDRKSISAGRIGGDFRRLGDDHITQSAMDYDDYMNMSPTLCWLTPRLRALPKEIRAASIWEGTEIIDGRVCDVVRIPWLAAGDRIYQRCWFDMERSANVLQAYCYRDEIENTAIKNVELQKFSSRLGHEYWLPVRFTYETNLPTMKNPKIREKGTAKGQVSPESVKINTGIKPEDIEIKVERHHRVFDMRKHRGKPAGPPAADKTERPQTITVEGMNKTLQLAKSQEAKVLAQQVRLPARYSGWLALILAGVGLLGLGVAAWWRSKAA